LVYQAHSLLLPSSLFTAVNIELKPSFMVKYTRYVRGSAILLVLARKAQQEIMIGDNIVVNIVKVSGNKIKIGITAPAGVSVYRSECRPELDQGCSEQPQKKIG
jgi:carbon storage regulator CsrA